MGFGIEHAHSGNDVAGQTDADDLHDGLEDEQGEISEVGVRAVRRQLVLGEIHEAIAAGVGRRSHQREVVGGLEGLVAQAQRLDAGEERHHGQSGSRRRSSRDCRDGRGAEGAGIVRRFKRRVFGSGRVLPRLGYAADRKRHRRCRWSSYDAETLNVGHDERRGGRDGKQAGKQAGRQWQAMACNALSRRIAPG